MCQQIKKGQVFCRACDYGPVVGRVYFLNPQLQKQLQKKEPKMLQSCSNCGKITEYGMFLEELFPDWVRRRVNFRFIPSKCFREEKLEALCVSLIEKGINPSTFIPSRFVPRKERSEELVLAKV